MVGTFGGGGSGGPGGGANAGIGLGGRRPTSAALIQRRLGRPASQYDIGGQQPQQGGFTTGGGPGGGYGGAYYGPWQGRTPAAGERPAPPRPQPLGRPLGFDPANQTRAPAHPAGWSGPEDPHTSFDVGTREHRDPGDLGWYGEGAGYQGGALWPQPPHPVFGTGVPYEIPPSSKPQWDETPPPKRFGTAQQSLSAGPEALGAQVAQARLFAGAPQGASLAPTRTASLPQPTATLAAPTAQEYGSSASGLTPAPVQTGPAQAQQETGPIAGAGAAVHSGYQEGPGGRPVANDPDALARATGQDPEFLKQLIQAGYKIDQDGNVYPPGISDSDYIYGHGDVGNVHNNFDQGQGPVQRLYKEWQTQRAERKRQEEADKIANAPVPQLDQALVERQIQAARQRQAFETSRAYRAQMEAAAYAGADPNAAAASGAQMVQEQGLAGAESDTRIRLQAATQNLQAQLVQYEQRIATLRQQGAYAQAERLAAIQAQLQRQLLEYQHELNSQVTGRDVFGLLGGAAGTAGGIALGKYI